MQKAEDLRNAAATSFYENVLNGSRWLWVEVIPWLSPRVIQIMQVATTS